MSAVDLLTLKTYRVSWVSADDYEDIQAYAVAIEGSGESTRVTFIRGGIVLSALSSEIAEVRLLSLDAEPMRPEDPPIGPDCRDGKCSSCLGGPCEHVCHEFGGTP